MKKADCFYLGHISKKRGFKGQLVAFLDVDDPSKYKELESVFVEVNSQLTPFFIQDISIRDKGFAHIKFEGVDNDAQVNPLLKAELYLPPDLVPAGDDEPYLHELIGMTVTDEAHGELGPVKDVFDQNGNRLLQVYQGATEILVPFNEDTTSSVDMEAGTILVRMPEGLLDIYLGTDDEDDETI